MNILLYVLLGIWFSDLATLTCNQTKHKIDNFVLDTLLNEWKNITKHILHARYFPIPKIGKVFSVQGQIINIFNFAGHKAVSVATDGNTKTVIDNTYTMGDCIPIQLYLQKQALERI